MYLEELFERFGPPKRPNFVLEKYIGNYDGTRYEYRFSEILALKHREIAGTNKKVFRFCT